MGTVATSAPIKAAWRTWFAVRIDAAKICLSDVQARVGRRPVLRNVMGRVILLHDLVGIALVTLLLLG